MSCFSTRILTHTMTQAEFTATKTEFNFQGTCADPRGCVILPAQCVSMNELNQPGLSPFDVTAVQSVYNGSAFKLPTQGLRYIQG